MTVHYFLTIITAGKGVVAMYHGSGLVALVSDYVTFSLFDILLDLSKII